MRSRAVREGSVGLLIVAGLVLFSGVAFWLNGLRFGSKSYHIIVEFADAKGLSVGTPVRYRGAEVGQIVNLTPRTNGVEAKIEIESSDLLIPKNAIVKATQSGFLNQSAIEITPLEAVASENLKLKPFGEECETSPILCNNQRLTGKAGASIDDLLDSTVRLSQAYSSPEVTNNVNKLLSATTATAADFAKLSAEFRLLSRSLRGQIAPLSNNVTQTTDSLTATARDISRSSARLSNTVDATANRLSSTVDASANQITQNLNTTTQNFNVLSENLNRLVRANESNLSSTLASLRTTGTTVQETLSELKPAVKGLNTALNPQEVEGLVRNLNLLVANATKASSNIDALVANTAATSENLRSLSASLNDPLLLLSLQQTLTSARETFENARKITADLDELTGDPAFRNNLRNLVDGLGNLVSSTQQLEQQMQLAQALEASHQTVEVLAADARHQASAQETPSTPEKPNPPAETAAEKPKQQPKSLTRSMIRTEPTLIPLEIQSPQSPEKEETSN